MVFGGLTGTIEVLNIGTENGTLLRFTVRLFRLASCSLTSQYGA